MFLGKYRDKMHFVSLAEADQFVSQEYWPSNLGGSTYMTPIQKCNLITLDILFICLPKEIVEHYKRHLFDLHIFQILY